MSPLRQAARTLVRRGAAALPPGQAEWGRAMTAELEHIDSDAAALRWGLGCYWAGRRQRLAGPEGSMIAGRVLLAGAIALYAAPRLPTAVAGWTLMTDSPERASDRLNGNPNLLDMLESIPPFFFQAGVLEYLCYLAAAAGLALGRRGAWTLVAAGFAFHLAQRVMFPWPWWRGEPATLGLLAVALAFAVWLCRRPSLAARREAGLRAAVSE